MFIAADAQRHHRLYETFGNGGAETSGAHAFAQRH